MPIHGLVGRRGWAIGQEPRPRLYLDPGPGDPEVGRWLSALADSRRDTLAELDGVTPAMVDWYPDLPLNNIGTLLYHVALIEADWVATEVLGLDDPPPALTELLPWPDRQPADAGEGRLTPIDGQALTAHVDRLAAVRTWAVARLEPLTNAELHRERRLPAYDVAPDWVFHHLLQHEAEHRSHIALLRDLHVLTFSASAEA
jgi:hypothetical protein